MRILFIILFLFTLNCSTNKVSKIHGFRLIENKYDKLTLNENNKNGRYIISMDNRLVIIMVIY